MITGKEKHKQLSKKYKELSNAQWHLQRKEVRATKADESLSIKEKQEFQSNLTVLRTLKKTIQRVS